MSRSLQVKSPLNYLFWIDDSILPIIIVITELIAFQLMIKRPSTLDNNQKMRRNRQTQYLIELDKCLQISSDDRLIIRRFIKDDDSEVVALFDRFKRDRSYANLQISLRKFVQLIKSEQRKNQTHYNQGGRRTSEYSQRIQSQHSQAGSYKTSAKCSPQKEEPKRKTITFDISDLKKKIENCQKSEANKRNNEKDISITVHREESVKRKLFGEKRSSSKDKNAFEKINSCSSRQLIKKEQSNFSKVTLRIRGQGEKLAQKPILKNDEPSICKGAPLGEIINNVSYSSSIRNLLICKLKDQKKLQRNNEKIISMTKIDSTIDKSQIFNQTVSDKINSSITYSVDKETIDGNQPTNYQDTAIKQNVPHIQDQIHHSAQLDSSAMTMYLKSDWRQTIGQSVTTRSRYIRNDALESKTGFGGIKQKLQTALPVEQQSSKFGQFYKRIRGIIDGSNC